jgi:DNA-directed RNA polymerase specialized sigma subunit
MKKTTKKQYEFDDSFYKLAEQVTRALERNGIENTTQKEQVEELMEAEIVFRETINKYRQSNEIYKKFLQRICIENKNILSARPYFRENAVNFSKYVTPAIKAGDIEALKKFDINYQFIKFIRDKWLGPFPKKAEALFQRVHRARNLLIENNIPLAINWAKRFYRKTPRSHLTLMDFIGICGMGLAAGIDKYCGKYSPVFRAVCIGRMTGNLIESYSETTLHFYPNDKRVIYKANSIKARQGIEDIVQLTEAVKKAFSEDVKKGKSMPKVNITVSELQSLMFASSTVSADAPLDDEGNTVYTYLEDINSNTEDQYIAKESTELMLSLAKKLPLIHRKILRLKGVKI